MAPIFYTRAGHLAAGSLQEIDGTDDSLFDDLFVADSFEPSKLGDWLNRRADVESRSDSEDSDGESVDSDGAEPVDSGIDSDDEFDIKVLAGAGESDDEDSQVTVRFLEQLRSRTTAAFTSSTPAPPPPPPTSISSLTTSTAAPPVTTSSTATTRGTASTQATSRRASSASTEDTSSTRSSRTSTGLCDGSTGVLPTLSTTSTPSIPSSGEASASSPSSSLGAPNPGASGTGSLSGVRAAGGMPPNVIAAVIVSTFFAIIIVLLAYRRFRINRARRSTEVPFPVEFVNPPAPRSSPYRFTLSSIIPKRVKSRHASPSMVSKPAPASWVEFPGGVGLVPPSFYGTDTA
ncbi:hypothetical protein C8R43DRAFT_965193 [Mycena crocata]|nr:hypothetical protein C8R43DRAFT_965193 [Mycena crocata]